MFGRSSFNRGFNAGQLDGIDALVDIATTIAVPAIKLRLEADAAEIRALRAENALLKSQLEAIIARNKEEPQ